MNRRSLIKKSASLAIVTPMLFASLVNVNGEETDNSTSTSTSASTDPCKQRKSATRPGPGHQWTCLDANKVILGYCTTLP